MDTFDYIVVGAGSGGCPVAARLSEDPGARVLLLEAGPADRNIWIHIPIGYYRNMISPLSWGYETEPEDATAGRRILWPRGKVLGGSSAINGLVYIRGQAADFDHWRQLGNAGWGYADVLPFFKRAEDQENGADDFHGAGGPLKVSNIKDKREICDAFIDAAAETGIPRNPDFNGADQEGVGNFQTTSANGRRCSSAVGYLKPARGRPNLKIETDAMVLRIDFDGTRAVGVTYRQRGREVSVRANAEIVLAGGAVNSPQLLQLSGVGPAAHLKSHGIDVVHDSPGVGADLQDHYQARLLLEVNKPITVNDEVNNPLRRIGIGLKYILQRRGPMTFSAGHVGVFTKVLPESATPDAQVHFIPFSATRPGGTLHPYPGVTASVCQLRPESRGTVMIASADPFTHPKIAPNYLSTDYDRRLMIEGLKMLRDIVKAPSFAKYLAMEHEPGDACVSDDDLLAYAREKGTTIFHPTSTCRMGNDARAVVDERLRVRGIQGVRVADCAIMPTLVSGNTNAAAIMIGEKCAQMMKEDAGRASQV
ncbi:MAG: GMC family oxidoreductase N-terminal domain-containing protein [Rhodospirillaceae bacterium]